MKALRYLWAFPATLPGLLFALLGALTGGQARLVDGVVEAHGGVVTALLRTKIPFFGSGAALTLGHVILGRDQHCLDRSRPHEHVHVQQYERWGPLLIPLYLIASLRAWNRGLDPYLDNPFEQEAFSREP